MPERRQKKEATSLRTPQPKKLGLSVPPLLRLPHEELIRPQKPPNENPEAHGSSRLPSSPDAQEKALAMIQLNSTGLADDAGHADNASLADSARLAGTDALGLQNASLANTTMIRWPSFDGRKISGLLYRPPAKFSGKRPVMIYLHGGPSTQTRPAFGGRNNYFLNELGIALIYPNYRGSSGYGKTFLRLDDGFLRDDARKDIGSLLDWIKSQPDLDPSRVLIYGESYGGFLALSVAVNYGDRIRAAYSVAGISNLVTYLQNSDAQVQELQRVEFGDERDPKMKDFLDSLILWSQRRDSNP